MKKSELFNMVEHLNKKVSSLDTRLTNLEAALTPPGRGAEADKEIRRGISGGTTIPDNPQA